MTNQGFRSNPVSIDEKKALDRLLALLAIKGPTGHEKAVAEHLTRELMSLGVPASAILVDDAPSRIPVFCEVGNLIVRLDGVLGGPRRLFCAHMDTVPLAAGADPVVREGRIYPKGATALGGDDRCGVAVLLTMISELKRGNLPHGPLTFLFSIREESGLLGAAAVRAEALGLPATGFNFDGGIPEDVTVGATGAMRMNFTVHGIAAHAGIHPERGVSAVAILADAVHRLEQAGWHGLIRAPEGSGTSNIGVVQGGDATNVVTDRIILKGEARSHDRRFLERIVTAYREAFHHAATDHRNEAGACGRFDMEVEDSYTAFALPQDAPCVQAAVRAVASLGLTPRLRISNGGLDANWLTSLGIPTVTLGCGQHEIHTTSEYVALDEYLVGCKLGLSLAVGTVP